MIRIKKKSERNIFWKRKGMMMRITHQLFTYSKRSRRNKPIYARLSPPLIYLLWIRNIWTEGKKVEPFGVGRVTPFGHPTHNPISIWTVTATATLQLLWNSQTTLLRILPETCNYVGKLGGRHFMTLIFLFFFLFCYYGFYSREAPQG